MLFYGHRVQERSLAVDGIRLNVQLAGSGPVVLLVHGFPGLGYSWRHQLPVLAAAGYTAVALDCRGYGLSDRPETGYTSLDHEADLIGVLDALEVEQAVVVGQDFGSRYAWNLARAHPERVRAVAGTVPLTLDPDPRSPTTRYAQAAAHHFLHFHYFQQPGRAEAELQGPNLAEFLKRLFWTLSGSGDYGQVLAGQPGTGYLEALPPAPDLPWPWLTVPEFAHYLQRYRSRGVAGELAGGLGSYRAADTDWQREQQLRGPVSQPSLLFIGELDPVLRFLQPTTDLLPAATVARVPGAGHFVQQEAPDRVNRLLLDFLARLPG